MFVGVRTVSDAVPKDFVGHNCVEIWVFVFEERACDLLDKHLEASDALEFAALEIVVEDSEGRDVLLLELVSCLKFVVLVKFLRLGWGSVRFFANALVFVCVYDWNCEPLPKDGFALSVFDVFECYLVGKRWFERNDVVLGGLRKKQRDEFVEEKTPAEVALFLVVSFDVSVNFGWLVGMHVNAREVARDVGSVVLEGTDEH